MKVSTVTSLNFRTSETFAIVSQKRFLNVVINALLLHN